MARKGFRFVFKSEYNMGMVVLYLKENPYSTILKFSPAPKTMIIVLR